MTFRVSIFIIFCRLYCLIRRIFDIPNFPYIRLLRITMGYRSICWNKRTSTNLQVAYAVVFTVSERNEKTCAERDKRKQRQIIPDISVK